MRDAFAAYLASFESLAQAYAPMWTSAARVQIEALNYANRRARFYYDLPSRFAACRTPADLMALQARCCTESLEHFIDASRRLTGALAPSSLAGAAPQRPRPKPNYIVFPRNGAGGRANPVPPERVAQILR